MPFLWKKGKGKRLSQLVSNHLHPPKRGASLILETGFPASLADLFVKNRDRFNNFNSNTNTNTNSNNNNVVEDSRKGKKKKRVIPPLAPIVIPPPSPLHSTSRNSSNYPTPSRVLYVPSPRPCGDSVFGVDVAVSRDPTDCEPVSGKNVFFGVLKMFFVVMIALGAKRFSVGIAISAFLLLLLEYAGRRLGGLLATSALARWVFSFLVGLFKRYEKLDAEAPVQEIVLESQEIELGSDLDSSKGSFGNLSTRKMEDLVSEIHVVQPSSNLVSPIREIPSVKYEINLRNGKEKWAEKAEAEVIETKQEQCISLSELLISEGNVEKATRRSKIKSKIKKLANKLNGSKSKHKKNKKLNEFKCEAFGSGSAVATNQGDEERKTEVESENESMSSSGVDFEADRVNIEDSICLKDSSNNDKNRNDREYVGREKSLLQYLVILVVVLVGLVGGRVLGLVFALSWFLILKFGLRPVSN